jgi:hypothetical protein
LRERLDTCDEPPLFPTVAEIVASTSPTALTPPRLERIRRWMILRISMFFSYPQRSPPEPGEEAGAARRTSVLVRGQETAVTGDSNGSFESPLAGEGVGARVSAVFTAAEKAAEHILSLAREEADDVRRRAQAEMETYRQESRNTAEQEAQRVIEAGHARAEELEREARMATEEIEKGMRERRNRLLEEMHLLEERVEWAREGLLEVINRLEEVTPREAGEIQPATNPS